MFFVNDKIKRGREMAKIKTKKKTGKKVKKIRIIKKCPACGRPMLHRERVIECWGKVKCAMCENICCPDYMDPTKTIPPIFKTLNKPEYRGKGIIKTF